MPLTLCSLSIIHVLDLSQNNISGALPHCLNNITALSYELYNFTIADIFVQLVWKGVDIEFGRSIKHLRSIDISSNHLVSEIPENIARRTPLSAQLQSFNYSQYMGNLGLCGPPVTQKCPGAETTQDPGITSGNKSDCNTEGDNDGLIYLGFYASIVLGFLIGFWGVYGTLLLKSSWRYAYFQVLNDTKDWIYVTTALHTEKLQWRLQR
ncbi:PREDICTED: LRR receptor [Prunus dulcis]|uniref:PREDICTED: LRR receptor n=1 Tax=Prunus dulcis TaxID=3755 RepID=A0A5E4FE23_PRUDU|nr:hypothetical protein L3X38_027276 [Prunus dulcis]VVA26215.1 PREDICTED: LRR receptor [Prunus dulcis]